MMKHKELVRDVFDRASPEYGTRGCSFFDYFGERLAKLATPNAGEKILDIATGKGAVLFPAAKAVGPYGAAIGIDLSQRMIKRGSKESSLSLG
jgi:O-methyltransferase/aklanonic acid methyltransferase